MMDFLDPKKTRAHTIRLIVGYILLAIAIGLAATILYYSTRYSVKEGKVVQNGVVFVSSSPGGADVYLNGERYKDQTNTRMVLETGTYTMKLTRNGYRDWQRALTVEGDSVDRFDYPLLIPRQLSSLPLGEYPSAPPLVTQSPDRRWAVVQLSGQSASFDIQDLRDPAKAKDARTTISLPANIFALPQAGMQSFTLAEWSRDNSHLLLQHVVGNQSEYVMLRRDRPDESYNLTKKLQLTASEQVSLQDKKPDRFFIHDTNAQTLSTATLDNPARSKLLADVVQYKTYGQDVVLYATPTGATDGRVMVKLYQDGKSYPVRQIAKHDRYLLDISTYDSSYYAVLGSPAEDHVYVYKDVASVSKHGDSQPLVPADILKLQAPDYLEFSANSQFIMAENGQSIAVYDAENERSYTYRLDQPIDAPQTHLTWMDGDRLRFVSQGKSMIIDYDGTNGQVLVPSSPRFIPFFDTSYEAAYDMAPADAAAPDGHYQLTQTYLRTVQDR